MMLYKNKKAMIHSPNGDTDFFSTLLLESCKEIYISAIFVYNHPKLHVLNVDWLID